MVVLKYGLKLKFCNARKWMYRKNILRKNCLFPTFLIEKRPFQNLSSHISLRVKTTIFQFRQKWNCNTWSLRKNILNGALKIVEKKRTFFMDYLMTIQIFGTKYCSFSTWKNWYFSVGNMNNYKELVGYVSLLS